MKRTYKPNNFYPHTKAERALRAAVLASCTVGATLALGAAPPPCWNTFSESRTLTISRARDSLFLPSPPPLSAVQGRFFLLRLCEFLKKGLDKLAKIWALRAS